MKKMARKLLANLVSLTLVLSLVSPAFAAEEVTLKVMDTTAGSPALIMVSGEPNEVVDLTITNPLRSTVTQPFQLNAEGSLQYWYPYALIAGVYQVTYRGETANFVVNAGHPDSKKSVLELNDYTAYTGEKIDGKITLKDAVGNLIVSRVLDIRATASSSVVCANNCRSNQQGMLFFSINSQKAGIKNLVVVDTENSRELFHEDLGFIPKVQPVQNNFMPNGSGYDVSGYQPVNPYQSFLQPASDFSSIPVFDPTQATADAQGNDDRFLPSSSFSYDPQDYYGASLLGTSKKFLSQVLENTSTSSGNNATLFAQSTQQAQSFEIVLGNDKQGMFEAEKSVEANSALDFVVRAVDAQKALVPNYTSKIKFEISPSGPLLPPDYSFTQVDQGAALFELAMVLPAGEYTLTVTDANNPQIKGEVKLSATLQSIPSLNNTNIDLKVESPVAKGIYSNIISVQGSTNTDNTEVSIKEGAVELKKVPVDEQKRFSTTLELADGLHKLDIIAVYLVDGSQTQTTIELEVDKTPPVITQVDTNIPPVRANENFSMKVEAEEGSTLKAFINNRAYEFTGQGTSYTLNARAPLDVGQFPISLQISDKVGNIDTANDVAVLTVTEPLSEIRNLFGIPGVGSMTLSWDPVPGALSYEVQYKSILGASENFVTDKNRITLENLDPELSYVFTVQAKSGTGDLLSIATDSRALKALPSTGGAAATTEPPVVTPVVNPTDLKPAAEEMVQTMPVRHTKSGPEVYGLILLSLLMLSGYGRLRRAFASAE